MSIAAGLSFTGCGNSSNGGSTGPTFEQVPLIGDGYNEIECEGLVDNISVEFLLYKSGNKVSITFWTEADKYDTFSGSWSAEQSPTSDNIYQIKLFNIEADRGCECTLKCNALTLTIPKDKLQDYRQGKVVRDSNLLEVDFEHGPSSDTSHPCNLPNGTTKIQGVVYAAIGQS